MTDRPNALAGTVCLGCGLRLTQDHSGVCATCRAEPVPDVAFSPTSMYAAGDAVEVLDAGRVELPDAPGLDGLDPSEQAEVTLYEVDALAERLYERLVGVAAAHVMGQRAAWPDWRPLTGVAYAASEAFCRARERRRRAVARG